MSAIPSWLLVAAQFGLLVLLIVTTQPHASAFATSAALALVVLGVLVGVMALSVNRPGNFNIRPEVRADAHLVTEGIYRHIRHPMYVAYLAIALAPVAADPRAWRALVWLALLGVLIVKLRREEGYLCARFPAYAAYQARTARFVPGLY